MTKNKHSTQVPVLPTNPHINTHYGMSSCSKVNDDPLAIIHLYLTSMDSHGLPPCLIYESFHSYFHPNHPLFFNLNLTLGPPQKRLSINRTWPLWLNSCSGLSSPMTCSLLPSTVRGIKGICSWVTEITERARVQWQMKSQRLVGFFLYWSSQLLYNVQFFKTILCGGIAPFLADSTVVLLTCSWVVKFKDSFMSLQTALLW